MIKFKKLPAFVLGGALTLSLFGPTNVSALEEKLSMSYLYFPSVSDYTKTVDSTNNSLNIVTPNYFDINTDGTLKITTKYNPSFVTDMHNRNIKVVPFLSNHWSRETGEKALSRKEDFAREIADAVQKYNLDGVNIDLEGLNETSRQNTTDFVKILKSLLPQDKTVSIAVAANPNGWTKGWHGSYDYNSLGQYADFLMIMAYDESWEGSSPGPVASLDFVERSVQYALNQGVPSNKIVLGLPFYGRLWNTTDGSTINGDGVALSRVNDLLTTYQSSKGFDSNETTPYATFEIKEGDPDFKLNSWSQPLPIGQYTLWYEDTASLKAKINLVHKYNLKGTGSWSVGQENPEVWSYFKSTLNRVIFKDVNSTYWAKDDIAEVYERKWMLGTSDTTFGPAETVTRAQAAAILVRVLGLEPKEPIKQSFSDIPSTFWAYKEIEIAKQHGLFSGTDGNKFSPNEPLTREQTAVVLFRVIGKGDSATPTQSYFKDVSNKRWSFESIEMMRSKGIYDGFADGTFKPTSPSTRAQMAALTLRVEPYLQ